MDIQVASNFERYLYYRLGEDPAKLTALMRAFGSTGRLSVPPLADGSVDALFAAGVGTTADTLATIRKYHELYHYLLDPHTAVGVHVAEQHLQAGEPTVCLATAHPAKFSEAIREATGKDLAHHEFLDKLADAETRMTVLPADETAVRKFIEEHV